LFRKAPGLHRSPQGRLDATASYVNGVPRDFDDNHVTPGSRDDLCNARAHRPTADDSYILHEKTLHDLPSLEQLTSE
jgi:hypothetical protein